MNNKLIAALVFIFISLVSGSVFFGCKHPDVSTLSAPVITPMVRRSATPGDTFTTTPTSTVSLTYTVSPTITSTPTATPTQTP